MSNKNIEWASTDIVLPEEEMTVQTKIDDADGLRNEQQLFRRGNMWFVPDGSMYVYYRPTHWHNV